MTLAERFATVSDSNDVIISGSGGASQYFPAKCNGADIFLTALITFQNETNKEDIDLCAAGERVDGIVVSEAWPSKKDFTKDSDSPYSDNTWIICYKPLPGDELYGTVATASSIAKDAYVKNSGGFLVTSARADAIGKLTNGGVAVTGVSGTEQIVSYQWGVN